MKPVAITFTLFFLWDRVKTWFCFLPTAMDQIAGFFPTAVHGLAKISYIENPISHGCLYFSLLGVYKTVGRCWVLISSGYLFHTMHQMRLDANSCTFRTCMALTLHSLTHQQNFNHVHSFLFTCTIGRTTFLTRPFRNDPWKLSRLKVPDRINISLFVFISLFLLTYSKFFFFFTQLW